MPKTRNLGRHLKKLEKQTNKQAKKMYGKPYDSLTELEKRKVRNALWGDTSRDITPIVLEVGSPQSPMDEKKIYNPALVNFCKSIYKPVATLRFVVHLVGGIITLLNLYFIYKDFSSAGMSALFTVQTLYVLGFVLLVVLLYFLQDLLFKIGWSDS